MARAVQHGDNYLSRLLKYIPTEIIMTYISIDGVLQSTYKGNQTQLAHILWVVAGVLLILTPLWLFRVMRVKHFDQILVSTLAFAVWLFAMGGPFKFLPWYQPALGAVALPLFTLLVPVITGKTS